MIMIIAHLHRELQGEEGAEYHLGATDILYYNISYYNVLYYAIP